MSLSDAFSALIKIRRVVVIVSILAGAGYKVAPMVWHKAEAKTPAAGKTTAEMKAAAKAVLTGNATNAAGTRISTCDLGAISLTNHCETCVPLGAGKDCVLTPKIIDSRNLQLTLAVESKTATGRIHDLTVTQVVTRPGKSLAVAVGEISFSLTPNITSE